MGVFSEMSMELQNGIASPFEDEGAFGQAESLPVTAGVQTAEETRLPFPPADNPEPAGDTDDGAEEPESDCAGELEEDTETEDKPVPDADAKKAQAAAEEEKRRTEHEAAEARRKEEWDAAQKAKKAAEQEQLERLKAMSDDEVMEASAKRVSGDTERLTRRNMKECVSEYIQTLCFSDPVFARLTMQPRKTMIHCFYFINRKAMEFLQQEMKDNGTKPEGPNGAYGGDVPDELCYQWAEEYFRDANAEEDKEKEEAFVPKPYIGKTGISKTKSKKPAEKKQPEKKPEPEAKKDLPDGQMSLLDLAMPTAKAS
ncbi:MAG: PcfK-like family protein [Clostridiaceae bacterium]|nr:PcfK-like family protein [Clostridiaceae bacterium]